MLHRIRQRLTDEGGFTLIELLVVVLIIGILSAIAIPAFLSQTSKANDSAAKTQVGTLQTTMETYAAENNGSYAAVASKGGSANTPSWYYNLKANPDVRLQDQTTIGDFSARELVGDERAIWWSRAVDVFEPFADYEQKAGRLIPVFVLEPAN